MEHVAAKTTDIATRVAEHFGITRQAACKHLRKLTQERALIASGNTRNRLYRLAPLREWSGSYAIAAGLEEDRVGRWTLRLNSPSFPKMLLTYGSSASLKCSTTRSNTQEELLELSKGKLTTDPRNHSGQGIFFTSRMLDSFDILSGGVMFTHKMGAHPDFILEMPKFEGGTTIFMELQNDTARTCKKIFDQSSSDDNYDFSETVIPVKLAQYGNDKLVSRSQAKAIAFPS